MVLKICISTRFTPLQPDLIIANKEENTQAQIEELQTHYPVHITDINTLPDALTMIREVGALVGKAAEAEAMVTGPLVPVRNGGLLSLVPFFPLLPLFFFPLRRLFYLAKALDGSSRQYVY